MAAKMPTPSKGFWSKHSFGDLPNWAWGGLIIGALVVIAVWNKNRQAAKTAAQAQGYTLSGQPLPGNIVPQYTFVDESSAIINVPTPPPSPAPNPTPTPTPPPKPPASPKYRKLIDPNTAYNTGAIDLTQWMNVTNSATPDANAPASPSGEWVTVDNGKYSTVRKIAEQIYGKSAENWDDPALSIAMARQNQGLVMNRGVQSGSYADVQVRPGDKVWVPGAGVTSITGKFTGNPGQSIIDLRSGTDTITVPS